MAVLAWLSDQFSIIESSVSLSVATAMCWLHSPFYRLSLRCLLFLHIESTITNLGPIWLAMLMLWSMHFKGDCFCPHCLLNGRSPMLPVAKCLIAACMWSHAMYGMQTEITIYMVINIGG